MDDFVAVGFKWTEVKMTCACKIATENLTIHQVGLSDDDKVYIACGENRIKYNGIKLLSMEQMKEYTNVLFTYI